MHGWKSMPSVTNSSGEMREETHDLRELSRSFCRDTLFSVHVDACSIRKGLKMHHRPRWLKVMGLLFRVLGFKVLILCFTSSHPVSARDNYSSSLIDFVLLVVRLMTSLHTQRMKPWCCHLYLEFIQSHFTDNEDICCHFFPLFAKIGSTLNSFSLEFSCLLYYN